MALDEAEQLAIAGLLAALEGGLRAAQLRFDRARSGADERHALMIALAALHQYAQNIAPDEALEAPIARLINHLAALDDGFVAPMLAPIKRRAGRPPSIDYDVLKGRAAVALELFIRARMSPDEAAGWIAKELRVAGYTIGRSGVLGWRKEVHEGRSSDLIRDRFDVIVAGNANSKDLRAAAQHVIKTLCERQPRRQKK